MRRWLRVRKVGMVAVALVAAACTNDANGPNDKLAIRIVAGGSATDTATAELVQALVIELRGAPATTVVRFETNFRGDAPYALVSSLNGSGFANFVADSLGTDGRASARVKLGQFVGSAAVRILVPEFGLIDSATFQIRPAGPAILMAGPEDTVVTPGGSVPLRAKVTDVWGNQRADPVTWLALDPIVTVNGTTATVTGSGGARIEARSAALRDTVRVGVVPLGTLGAVVGAEGIVFRTDGTILRRVPLGSISAVSSDWSPDGTTWIIDGGDQSVRVVTTTDVTTVMPAGASLLLYPEVASDGRSFFYGAMIDGGWSIRRRALDGATDELIYGAGSPTAPALSPTGNRMALVQLGGDVLNIVTLPNGQATAYGNGHTPAWRPQGDVIAFLSTQDLTIGVIGSDGTDRRRLSNRISGYGLGLDWSPDGNWLVARGPSGLVLISYPSGLEIPLGFTDGWVAPSWAQ